jgi:hypothetical protein
MKRITQSALGLLALAAATAFGTARAQDHTQDRADLDRTQIIGNRELPKVLYIVPWKKPVPGALSGRPVHSVLDEALAPVDREVFRRQVDYGTQIQQQLQARAAAKTARTTDSTTPASPPPAPTGETR